MMWPIIKVWSTSKTKLSFRDWLNLMRFVIKSSQDNNMINHIGLVYTETETEPIGPVK